MINRKLFYGVLVVFLFLSTEGCGKAKTPPPEVKKPEPTVVAPVVAGQFYPAEKEVLRTQIGNYLRSANPAPLEEHLFGIIVPHAGYQYSGPVAAYAYKLLEKKQYSTVVVMAPSHHVPVEGVALTTKDFYETPLGKIPIAKDIAQKLLKDHPAWATEDPRPYSVEHSLEVELPFLQTVLGDFRLLPIIVGVHQPQVLEQLARALNDLLPGDDVLFVASTDLSHYHPYDEAVAKDKKTLKLIEKMDVAQFAQAVEKDEAELCGSAPVIALMELAKLRGWKPTQIHYANSGDTTGDKSRVVGYGAIAFVGKTRDESLSAGQKETLLTIARKAIEAQVLGRKRPPLDVKDPVLLKEGAAFVTIRKHGALRGCIGHIIAIEPLVKSIQDNAIAAASEDPRFSPVRPDELKDIDVEISVLTQPQPLPNPLDVRVGTDGLIIKKGFHRGVLLPQVPTEQGWNKEQFLEGICEKAGLPPDSWKDAELMRFQAIVFHE
jgi:hypothetical protein